MIFGPWKFLDLSQKILVAGCYAIIVLFVLASFLIAFCLGSIMISGGCR